MCGVAPHAEGAELTRPDSPMKNFSLVPTSEGPRREFKITWGLRAGYGPSGRIHNLEEAIRAAHRWMRGRIARAEPFLSGMFTRGEVVYAGSEAEAAHDREPVAIFTGEVLPFYAADIDDDRIRILLNELAAEIFPGRCLAMFLPAGTCGAGPSGSMFRLSSRWARWPNTLCRNRPSPTQTLPERGRGRRE